MNYILISIITLAAYLFGFKMGRLYAKEGDF